MAWLIIQLSCLVFFHVLLNPSLHPYRWETIALFGSCEIHNVQMLKVWLRRKDNCISNFWNVNFQGFWMDNCKTPNHGLISNFHTIMVRVVEMSNQNAVPTWKLQGYASISYLSIPDWYKEYNTSFYERVHTHWWLIYQHLGVSPSFIPISPSCASNPANASPLFPSAQINFKKTQNKITTPNT